MAKLRYAIFHVFIYLVFVTVTNSEIHRAKANVPKHVVKTNAGAQESSYVAEGFDKLMEEMSIQMPNIQAMLDTKFGTWLFSISGAVLVGLSGIFPLLVIPLEAGPALKHGAAAARLKLLLSFAVGGLLGDVFLHLLPEAWDHLHTNGGGHDEHTKLGLWVIAGMLSFLIIEKIFAKEDEYEHLQDECAEAEEEKRLEAEYQRPPLHQHQTGSPNTITESIANRTRQKTKLSHDQPSHESKTGSSNGKSMGQSNKRKTDVINKNKDSIHNRIKPRSQLHESGNDISSKTINKSNGAIVPDPGDSTQTSSIKVSGYLNLAANVIDNFTHGLAVAGGFLVSSKVGFVTLFAILLHEIPHEVGDFAILLRSGFDRWKAAKAQVCTAASGVIGALTALTADSASAAGDSTVWILPFTSGGFIYIALVTVVPDLLEERHPVESSKQILCLLAGIGTMYLVSCIH